MKLKRFIKRFFLPLTAAVIALVVLPLLAFTAMGPAGPDSPPPQAELFVDSVEPVVEKAVKDITGSFDFGDTDKVSITFEQYCEIDDGELNTRGEAVIDGNNFVLPGVKLKPSGNTIVVKAAAGEVKKTKTIEINYDPGKIKDVTLRDVAQTDSKGGLNYVVNNLLVYFDENTENAERQAIIETVGGKRVGSINGANMWQVEVEPDTYDGLKAKAEKLMELEGVFYADCNMAGAAKPMLIPNDPWYSNGSPAWSELKPRGGNWSVEAIQALSAWDYQYFFNHIKVGVVDTGVDTEHEDLAGKIVFADAESAAENKASNHGTHVAGIMGAVPNNGIGVTGILWDTKVYSHNWDTLMGTDAHLYSGLTKTVEAGAKVVNFSLGLGEDISGYGPPETNAYVKSYANQSKAVMVPLLNAGYEFIVTQSSGNGQNGYSQDAIYNGYFCSVTYTNLTGIGAEMITKINERIMIIGSARYDGDLDYMQATSSNAGSQVDICAPGQSVYSCYISNNYNYMSGTSMAAPVAGAVAALTWSVNPELTGAQVRDILLTNTNTAFPVKDNPSPYHPLVNTYQMVNALLSVEAAIATLETDYSAVEAAIALANTYDENLYTTESWAELTNAVNSVVYGLEPKQQPLIDAMAEAINTAIANLEFKSVSYTVEYRLNSETGEKLGTDKIASGQVTKTVTESARSFAGYVPMKNTSELTLQLTGNKIVFIYIPNPVYGATVATYKSSGDQLIPVTAAARGDEIIVRVTPSSNFYCGTAKFVIMYDKDFYELVGINKLAFTVNEQNAYYANAADSYTGQTFSPPAAWPSTFTEAEKAKYNHISITFTPPSVGYPAVFDGSDWLFSFKLVVKSTAAGEGRIFMDHRWTRTSTYTSGAQYFMVCPNGEVLSSTGNATMPLTADLAAADRSVALAEPVTVSFDLNGGSGTLPEPLTGVTGMPLILPGQGDINKLGYSFLGWALTDDAQTPLDSFYFPADDIILYAVWLGEAPVIYGPDGEVQIELEHFIFGIEPGTLKSQLSVTGNYYLEFPTAGNLVGTGTIVRVLEKVTHQLYAEYTVVIYGDLNGDGIVDSMDGNITVNVENFIINFDPVTENAFLIAGDVNADGIIDSIDAGIISGYENYFVDIDQQFKPIP